MFIKTLMQVELRVCNRILARALNTKSPWDIVTGVCVERLPVVTPPLNDIQKKYKEMLYAMEVNKSLKSDHEIRHENDKIQAELLKKDSGDMDMDAVSKITAQDFEDAATEELAKFQFAPIETEADKKCDKTSTDRYLQRHLVLVTPHKLGKDIKILLPQGLRKEGETLRQTAERVLKEHCPELNVQFVSNAPCGFYKYKYPSEIEGQVGAKVNCVFGAGRVFFYYACYKTGNVDGKSKANWLTRNELAHVLPERYNRSVHEFLIKETY